MATTARQKKQSAEKPAEACLVCDGVKPLRRGRCSACAALQKARIQAKKTTESELIELGLLLPSNQGKRPELRPLDIKLAAARAKASK